MAEQNFAPKKQATAWEVFMALAIIGLIIQLTVLVARGRTPIFFDSAQGLYYVDKSGFLWQVDGNELHMVRWRRN